MEKYEIKKSIKQTAAECGEPLDQLYNKYVFIKDNIAGFKYPRTREQIRRFEYAMSDIMRIKEAIRKLTK